MSGLATQVSGDTPQTRFDQQVVSNLIFKHPDNLTHLLSARKLELNPQNNFLRRLKGRQEAKILNKTSCKPGYHVTTKNIIPYGEKWKDLCIASSKLRIWITVP